MTVLYRLLISIAARLLMLAIGLLFVWTGGTLLLLFLDSNAREALTALNNTHAATEFGIPVTLDPKAAKPVTLQYPHGLDWRFVAYTTALGLVQFSGGATLVFVGARGLWRRYRAGWPKEDESRAATPVGRLASAAIFAAGAMLGLLRLTLLVFAVTDQTVLAWTGVKTEAVIIEKWSGDWAPPGSDGRPTAGYQVAYRFHLQDGETVRHETRISGDLFRQVEDGSVVPVVYSAAEPANNRIEFAQPAVVLVNALIWLGLLSVGIWGLRRNLGAGGPGAGKALPQFEGGRSSGASATPARPRRQFGQRTR